MHIARLTPVPLRTVWQHEARNFTTWLAKNLDYLEDVTNISLDLLAREAATGNFLVDILAEDHNGNLVIIENQLEKTDHDHLGKLLTYMSNHNAKTAIWITSKPRPEHEKAVHWLNETLPVDTAFYLIQIEAYRIGESAPAPKFTVVAGPNEESRQIGSQRKELAERHKLRLAFWQELLGRANSRTSLHARVSPSVDNLIGAGAGKSGLAYRYIIRMQNAHVELHIATDNPETNQRIFEQLHQHHEQIEADFGTPLEWQPLEGKRTAHVRYLISSSGLRAKERWPLLQDEMIDAMIRLHNALDPHIRALQV